MLTKLKQYIVDEAKKLHMEASISGLNLDNASVFLQDWLAQNMHGTMEYMKTNAHIRRDPRVLLPNALRAIMLRLNYADFDAVPAKQYMNNELDKLNLNLNNNIDNSAVISIYARGRDYHKVLRQQIKKLALKIENHISKCIIEEKFNNKFEYRVFTDSAPIMEVELANQSGLGWRGKHTLLINPKHGSMFFLGGMLTNIPLEIDEEITNKCGTCSKCIDICPTKAIIAPYKIDARKCISYLTIEHDGIIPVEMREYIGKHIYGCDECQLVCPWNKFAQQSMLADFNNRNYSQNIISLWNLNEEQFLHKMKGSAIRRIGYAKWKRNLVVVMGNYIRSNIDNDNSVKNKKQLRAILQYYIDNNTEDQQYAMIVEHAVWAIAY
jgi:epoxyqueuosine reductase